MSCLSGNIKNNYIRIFAAAAIVFITVYLYSCADTIEPYEDAEPAVSYINASNDGAEEQRVSDLYENAGAQDKIIMRDPFNLTLSHNNYFYLDAIYVEITSDIENAEIYYSLDSTEPSRDNTGKSGKTSGTKKYEEPVFLDKTDNNSPYVLKIKAYSEDNESRVVTHTYFVCDKIDSRFDENTFVFSISSEPDGLYGYVNGILVEGKLRTDFIRENPFRDITPPDPANYNLRGREGEREAYVEVFTPEGKLLISQGAGVRVHGGWSRAANKKSLALYARDEYDMVFDRFYYGFFDGNKRNDEYGSYIYDYKTLLLRNGANDREGAYMREELSQSIAKKAEFPDYHEFAPAAVFLNGEYYGFFWLQNFFPDDYFEDKYGADNENLIEIMEPEDPGADIGILRSDDVFEKFRSMVDIDNYIKYYALEIYISNWDWPQNNKKSWRYTGGDGTYINEYLDGKYRMLFYDAEGGWGIYGNGHREMTIQRIKKDGTAPVFTELMKRQDMAEKFSNQMFDLMNTVFTYESVEEEYNKIVGLYEYEIGVSIRKKVISNWMSAKNMESQRKSILNFAQRRRSVVITDMTQSFKLSGDTYDVNVRGSENADITLNTIKLSGAGDINSCYFTEHSVKLKAEPYPGYLFDYWEIGGKKYFEPELSLSAGLSVNGKIDAVLFTKPDDSYSDIVIKTVRLDNNLDSIVLYNPGDKETVIENIYLSNDKADLKKFYIKKVRFPAKSAMTYYGRNYADYIKRLPDGSEEEVVEIKSNRIFDFKIRPGETIYLSDKNGEIIKEVYIPETFNPDRGEEISRNYNGSYEIIKIK